MSWRFDLVHVQIIFFTCFLSSAIAIITLGRRKINGAPALFLTSTAITIWTLAAALEAAAVDPNLKVLLSQLEYIGFVNVTPFMLLFVLTYTQQLKKLRFHLLALIWVIPAVTLFLAWTNSLHGLVWPGFSAGPQDANILIYQHGPVFYIHLGYIYLLFFTITLILVREFFWAARPFRMQFGILIVSSIFPAISGIMYVFGTNPIPGLDWSPISFGITNSLFAWSIFRLNLLDLAPVAREMLVEQLKDGLLVFDPKGRIIDMNRAAEQILTVQGKAWIGQPAGEVLPKELGMAVLKAALGNPVEVVYRTDPDGDQNRYLELRVSPLFERPGHATGEMLIVRDITRRKQAELALQKANQRLQDQIDEINRLQDQLHEQAVRDTLTGLYNRRRLDEIIDEELAAAQRNNHPVGFLMLDIDHFKELNDRFGHVAGDQILQGLGKLILSNTGVSSRAFRYGGDEFLIIYPRLGIKKTLEQAEWLRSEFQALCQSMPEIHFATTCSAGTAVYPLHGKNGEELIRVSDIALYMAKEQGRNRVVMYSNPDEPL